MKAIKEVWGNLGDNTKIGIKVVGCLLVVAGIAAVACNSKDDQVVETNEDIIIDDGECMETIVLDGE